MKRNARGQFLPGQLPHNALPGGGRVAENPDRLVRCAGCRKKKPARRFLTNGLGFPSRCKACQRRVSRETFSRRYRTDPEFAQAERDRSAIRRYGRCDCGGPRRRCPNYRRCSTLNCHRVPVCLGCATPMPADRLQSRAAAPQARDLSGPLTR